MIYEGSIIYTGELNKTKALVPIETLNTTMGATAGNSYYTSVDGTAYLDSTSCNNQPHSSWSVETNTCLCDDKWWGEKCDRDTYDERFISVGEYDPAIVTLNTINTTNTQTLGECTDLCINSPSCSGVVYINNVCNEYETATVASNKTIPFLLGVNPNMYVKNEDITSLIHPDRTFLFAGVLPLRHWERTLYTSVESSQITVFNGVVYLLPFFPLGYIGDMIGVYSLEPFEDADYYTLLLGGDTDVVYIHYPGNPLQIPPEWNGKNIWVEYRVV